MLKTLCSLEIKKFLGINVFLNSRQQETVHRHSGMNLLAYGILYLILLLQLMGQTAGLNHLGASRTVPCVLIFAGTMLTLLVSVFGIGQGLYSRKGLDMLRAMPVSSEKIMLSRLLSQAAAASLMSATLLGPCALLHGTSNHMQLNYYMVMFWGILVLPLLPLALSALLNTGILAVSGRTRHPAGVQVFLTVILMILLLVFPLLFNPIHTLPKDPDLLVSLLLAELPRILPYPPAHWVSASAAGESCLGICAYILLSLSVFSAAAWILCRNFDRICLALSKGRPAGSFQIKSAFASSPLKALYLRERKRYFSSPIYVSNTIIGPVLSCIAALALIFPDPAVLRKYLPLSPEVLIPPVWAVLCSMMPACSVAVTMEGKQIWQIKTLPVSPKTWLLSKLLMTFTLIVPSYVISQIAMTIAFRPSLPDFLWQVFMPAAMLVFSCSLALAADLRLHNFNFEKEETAVKQSLSALAGGLGSAVPGLLFCAVLIFTHGNFMVKSLLFVLTAGLSVCLYIQNSRVTLESL